MEEIAARAPVLPASKRVLEMPERRMDVSERTAATMAFGVVSALGVEFFWGAKASPSGLGSGLALENLTEAMSPKLKVYFKRDKEKKIGEGKIVL